jgi:hypothetical protein
MQASLVDHPLIDSLLRGCPSGDQSSIVFGTNQRQSETPLSSQKSRSIGQLAAHPQDAQTPAL